MPGYVDCSWCLDGCGVLMEDDGESRELREELKRDLEARVGEEGKRFEALLLGGG